MRQFVVVGHDAPTDPDFSLDDLTGAGRLDVLCRCVTAAFVLSHAVREDVRLHLVLDAYTITFDGADLRRLNPDERSTAALIRGALERREEAVGRMPVESHPGVELRRRGFAETVDALDGTLLHLHEDGTPAVDRDLPTDPVFVLSDHRDFRPAETDLLADRADARIRLGPRRLHADHAIVVAHNYLDTDGFRSY
jgi:tRNA (pseudouridine54-N1)-methyltransferase